MSDLEAFRYALIENNFPYMVLLLLYLPLMFIVMLFNVMRESLMFWVVAALLIFLLFLLMGALVALCYTGYRGFKIYSSRFDSKGKSKKK